MTSIQSPIRYPGGKFRARKILKNYVPENTEIVVSPFFGGGSFELELTGKELTVVAYDGFPLLANFWEQLLLQPAELASLIRSYGKIDSSLFKSFQVKLKQVNEYEKIDEQLKLEFAAEFFIVNRCSFSGATLSGGFSKESSEKRFTPSSVQKVEDFNNPHLSVAYGLFENTLSKNSLDQVEADFLFLDPPYLLEKGKNTLYGIGGDLHKTFNHVLLHDLVVESGLPFTLTYNNSDEIKDLWKDFNIYDAEWSYGMNASKKSSEIVITNHDYH